jgi:hypothetical protein
VPAPGNLYPYSTVNFGVPYGERPGYGEHFQDNTNESVRILHCPWNQRGAFMYALLGDSFAAHPEYNWMYAQDCEMLRGEGQPRGAAVSGLITYIDPSDLPSVTSGLAVYKVTYRNLDYEVSGSNSAPELHRYLSRYTTFTAEALPLPPASFDWKSDGSQIPEAPAKNFFGVEATYLWHLVPRVPYPTILKNQGKVNAGQFDTGTDGLNLDPETALFMGLDLKRVRTGAGKKAWDITYKLLVKTGDPAASELQPNWNRLFRRKTGRWEDVVVHSTGAKPYTTFDMGTLFQLA